MPIALPSFIARGHHFVHRDSVFVCPFACPVSGIQRLIWVTWNFPRCPFVNMYAELRTRNHWFHAGRVKSESKTMFPISRKKSSWTFVSYLFQDGIANFHCNLDEHRFVSLHTGSHLFFDKCCIWPPPHHVNNNRILRSNLLGVLFTHYPFSRNITAPLYFYRAMSLKVCTRSFDTCWSDTLRLGGCRPWKSTILAFVASAITCHAFVIFASSVDLGLCLC